LTYILVVNSLVPFLPSVDWRSCCGIRSQRKSTQHWQWSWYLSIVSKENSSPCEIYSKLTWFLIPLILLC